MAIAQTPALELDADSWTTRQYDDLQRILANIRVALVDHELALTDGSSDSGFLPLSGGTMTGEISMGADKITNVTNPSNTQDAATKAYSDLKLLLTGGTLSGALAMGTNKITGVVDPTADQEAATKKYVDDNVGGESVKGWVYYSMVTIDGTEDLTGVYDSFNVISIVDKGPGRALISWDTDFANEKYAVTGLCDANGVVARFGPTAPTAGAVEIITFTANTVVAADYDHVTVVALGDQ